MVITKQLKDVKCGDVIKFNVNKFLNYLDLNVDCPFRSYKDLNNLMDSNSKIYSNNRYTEISEFVACEDSKPNDTFPEFFTFRCRNEDSEGNLINPSYLQNLGDFKVELVKTVKVHDIYRD